MVPASAAPPPPGAGHTANTRTSHQDGQPRHPTNTTTTGPPHPPTSGDESLRVEEAAHPEAAGAPPRQPAVQLVVPRQQARKPAAAAGGLPRDAGPAAGHLRFVCVCVCVYVCARARARWCMCACWVGVGCGIVQLSAWQRAPCGSQRFPRHTALHVRWSTCAGVACMRHGTTPHHITTVPHGIAPTRALNSASRASASSSDSAMVPAMARRRSCRVEATRASTRLSLGGWVRKRGRKQGEEAREGSREE